MMRKNYDRCVMIVVGMENRDIITGSGDVVLNETTDWKSILNQEVNSHEM